MAVAACIMQLVTKTLSQSIDSRNQVTAAFLAQEGVELVRNIRDNNWGDSNPSTTSFTHIPTTANARIDHAYAPGSDIEYTAANKAYDRLYLDANGYYAHSGATATIFYRRVAILDKSSNKQVTSMVVWGAADFPTVDGSTDAISQCTTANKCTYARITMTNWGG